MSRVELPKRLPSSVVNLNCLVLVKTSCLSPNEVRSSPGTTQERAPQSAVDRWAA